MKRKGGRIMDGQGIARILRALPSVDGRTHRLALQSLPFQHKASPSFYITSG